MKKTLWSCLLTVFLLAGVLGTSSAEWGKGQGLSGSGAVVSAAEFRATLKRLWLENLGYSRHLVLSSLTESPDLEKVKARLAKNQVDLAEEFKTFYGEEASAKLIELLKNHSTLAEEVIKTLAKGTPEQFLEVNAKWEAAAEELAGFLQGKNPKWVKQNLENLLFKEMNATVGQVTARLKKDWDSDFAYWDKALAGILALSDTLADGIIRQFPKRFKK